MKRILLFITLTLLFTGCAPKECGEIPKTVTGTLLTYGHFAVESEPTWSPDCKHIAWSVWQSGTWSPEMDEDSAKFWEEEAERNEGIYIYDTETEKIERFYDQQYVTPEFVEWKDKKVLIFEAMDKNHDKYNYFFDIEKIDVIGQTKIE